MIKVIPILFILFNAQGALERNVSDYDENKGLVANGQPYDIVKYPFVVFLVKAKYGINTKFFSCTGSLISKLFVLTAAHCTEDATIFDITVFSHIGNGQQRHVKRIYQNKMYNLTLLFHSDITLLKLQKPFNNVEHYVSVSGRPNEFANGTSLDCVVIGFGSTANGTNPNFKGYMTNSSVAYGPTACAPLNSSDRDKNWIMNSYLHDSWTEFLCSKPDIHMICPGDSGGPLICNGFLYGIASHGYNFKDATDEEFMCGSDHMQTRHLFVHNYRQWIFDVMNEGNPLIPLHKLYMTSIMLVSYVVAV